MNLHCRLNTDRLQCIFGCDGAEDSLEVARLLFVRTDVVDQGTGPAKTDDVEADGYAVTSHLLISDGLVRRIAAASKGMFM